MLCWGSWANTQKLTASTWRFELFYWDYVLGILILSLIFAFTLGSNGGGGRSFSGGGAGRVSASRASVGTARTTAATTAGTVGTARTSAARATTAGTAARTSSAR